MSPPKIAIVHPQLRFGGSEARALWGVEALKRDFNVTLITGGVVDLGRLNAYYGTRLDAQEFSIRTVRMPLGLHRSAKFAGLRGAFVQRYIKRVAREFDLMISTYNPCDFGVPGVQFIADFSFIDEWRDQLHPELNTERRWWYGDSLLRRSYLGLCGAIAPVNREPWKQNLTVANSDWSGNLLRREFGIESRTLYPPVAAEFPVVPWEQKENGFVCVGRIVPEKRMDAVIRILDKVRAAGHDVHLHILGGLDDSPFGVTLLRMAVQRGWIRIEGRTFGQRKIDLMAGHRFGINACENEAFGIAPAELVKAGCITFVPASGGQQEIVDHPMLTIGNEEDAAGKICSVLSSVTLQEDLRRHLAGQAQKFSVQNFQAGLRQVVSEFLNIPVPQSMNHA